MALTKYRFKHVKKAVYGTSAAAVALAASLSAAFADFPALAAAVAAFGVGATWFSTFLAKYEPLADDFIEHGDDILDERYGQDDRYELDDRYGV